MLPVAVGLGVLGLVARIMTTFVAVLVSAGCTAAGTMLGGAGAGLTGGRNEALDAEERNKDRQADAARFNAQRCDTLLEMNHQQYQFLIESHRDEGETLKQILAADLGMARTGEQKVAAYTRYAEQLDASSKSFQKRSHELEARAEDVRQRCK
jgi:hypothetical protein